MGQIINVSDKDFQGIIDAESKTILVDFWAEWCGPCRMLGPVLEEVSEEVDDVVILKVNVDDNSELPTKFGIRSIPAVLAFKDGEVADRFVGVKRKEEIISFIERIGNE